MDHAAGKEGVWSARVQSLVIKDYSIFVLITCPRINIGTVYKIIDITNTQQKVYRSETDHRSIP